MSDLIKKDDKNSISIIICSRNKFSKTKDKKTKKEVKKAFTGFLFQN